MSTSPLVLDDSDFIAASTALACPVFALQAVAEVESAGSGFDSLGWPKVLFEGHHFCRLTRGKFSSSYPTLSYPKWTRKFYGKTNADEHARLNFAKTLDLDAALKSTSWGMFQILGANFKACGFPTVQSFVEAQCKDADSQLRTFCAFLTSSGLLESLRELRWRDFARGYNGPSFYVNRYEEKLSEAYARLVMRA